MTLLLTWQVVGLVKIQPTLSNPYKTFCEALPLRFMVLFLIFFISSPFLLNFCHFSSIGVQYSVCSFVLSSSIGGNYLVIMQQFVVKNQTHDHMILSSDRFSAADLEIFLKGVQNLELFDLSDIGMGLGMLQRTDKENCKETL